MWQVSATHDGVELCLTRQQQHWCQHSTSSLMKTRHQVSTNTGSYISSNAVLSMAPSCLVNSHIYTMIPVWTQAFRYLIVLLTVQVRRGELAWLLLLWGKDRFLILLVLLSMSKNSCRTTQGHVFSGFRCVAFWQFQFLLGASFNPPCNNSLCCVWLQSSLDLTGTFKYMKTKLVKEGFDPNQITDLLYFLNVKDKDYVPLTLDIFSSVTSGKIKI